MDELRAKYRLPRETVRSLNIALFAHFVRTGTIVLKETARTIRAGEMVLIKPREVAERVRRGSSQ